MPEPAPTENPVSSITSGKKLPSWQIVLVVAGGAAVVYYIWKKNQSSSSSPQYLPATTGGANPAEFGGGTGAQGSNNEGLTGILGILQQQNKENAENQKLEAKERAEQAKQEREQRTAESKERGEHESEERKERTQHETEERKEKGEERTHLQELIKGITKEETETIGNILKGITPGGQVNNANNETPGYYYNPEAAPHPTPAPSPQTQNPPEPAEQVITETGKQVNEAGGFGTGMKDLFGGRFIVNPNGTNSYILGQDGQQYPNNEYNRGHPKHMRK